MIEKPPADPAHHAEDFSHRYADRLEEYCSIRMQELGLPDDKIGSAPLTKPGIWRAFDPEEGTGGAIERGIVVNSGCLNRDLMRGRKGSRIWATARLRDRIDAIIAHEYEEDRTGSHEAAVKEAPRTKLPITEGARRICRAMAR
jgi:hypothetical protein